MFRLVLAIVFIVIVFADCPGNTVQWPQTSPSKCYTLVAEKATFNNAEKRCIANGGHLTSVHESFTNSFLSIEANYTKNFKSDFWLGAKSYNLPESWNWTDGTPFDFNEWKSPPPSGAFCGAFDIKSGLWNAVDCKLKKSYVCKNDETATTATTTKPSKPCPVEWVYFEETNSCYYLAGTPNWQTTEDLCKSFGAHLMSVHSQSEVNFTKTIYNGDMWIGLYSKNNPIDWNSTWQYTDGSTVDYTNWRNYQAHDRSQCVQIHTFQYNHYFENINCSTLNYGMCKKSSVTSVQSLAPITSTTQASPYCLNGWFYNANTSSCYTVTPAVNWTQSEEFCRFNNAHLTSFHDQNELNFLSSTFIDNLQYGHLQSMWIGLYSADNETTWNFTDGSPFNYRPWNHGDPYGTWNNCGYYDIVFNKLHAGGCGDNDNNGICKRLSVI
jgi:hypothetical protein